MRLQKEYQAIIVDILGIQAEDSGKSAVLDHLMQLVIEMRQEARQNKDFATSDKIRDALNAAGVQLKDGADGTGYTLN